MLDEPDLPEGITAALHEVRRESQSALADIASLVRERDDTAETARRSLRARVDRIDATLAAVRGDAADDIAPDVERVVQAARQLGLLLDGLSERVGASTEDASGADTPDGGSSVVLVVDDDPANREVLRRRLERLGLQVLEAPDGAEALGLLAGGGIDLVLLDLMMPVLDGMAVLEQRQRDEVLGEIPVIMISASDDVGPIARCIELGAEDYLVKPFDPVLLRARVEASIQRKRLRDREAGLVALVTRQAEELRSWNADLERRIDEKVRELEQLEAMERFVSPQLAALIRDGGRELLESHRREIVVLFCDLRGFTSFAEMSEPEDVVTVLRELHATIGPAVLEHGGTLAQYTGDGLMAFFNDPVPIDDAPGRAVSAAVEARDRTSTLSARWARRGQALQLGLGLAMGHATCGQIGFQGRYEYTAIGTVVNLAARLCGEAAGGEILADERLCSVLGGRVRTRDAGELELKGLARPVRAFSVEPSEGQAGTVGSRVRGGDGG